ncbi:hypothetical protein ACHAWO_007965 [Cyclotella atomus]|uniref:Uncharacterized protein n=1 Tax=Cyclotella atomus TaxID=382360 RepID=A0ABD3MZH4_9STRA
MRLQWSLHRWGIRRGSLLSRHISSSAAASLLLNCPLAQPQRSHNVTTYSARWQRQHAYNWQAVCQIFPISVRPIASRPRSIESFSIRHFGSRRGSKVIQAIDYDSIDDLLRDSCDALN